MDDTHEFKATLTGPGISVERNITQEDAFNVLAAIMGKATTVTVPEDRNYGADKPARPVSLREFMTETNPSTHVEKIVTIGSYLHDHKGASSFSKADIEEGYRSAREQMPGNLSRDISSAVNSGWLDDAGEKGRFHVTNTGAKAVAAKFKK